MYYEQLRENLFARVLYPPELKQMIAEVIPAWKEFCSLPEELKHKFGFLSVALQYDVGYRRKLRENGYDQKQYFHYSARVTEFIQQENLQPWLKTVPVLQHFFESAGQVHGRLMDFTGKIAVNLDSHIPGVHEQFVEARQDCLIRFLHYYPGEKAGDVLAERHYDRCGYTLHLYESHAGLEFMDWDMQWVSAPLTDDCTVVFPGYQMDKFTNGKLQKTWHRVVCTSPGEDRYSAVLFIRLTRVPTYAYNERSQDQKPSYVRS